MKTPSSDCVLGRTSPCDVPQGYASLAAFPAALLHGVLIILRGVFSQQYSRKCMLGRKRNIATNSGEE